MVPANSRRTRASVEPVARSIYITSAEGHSGKSSVALGVLDTLTRELGNVGVFRPIARSITERDYVLETLLAHDGVKLSYEQCVGVTYDDVHENPDAALAEIVERFKSVERQT
jgi:phosphate acetyltransferase